MAFKPLICLDFDGVLHSYTSGWQGSGVVTDGPVPGAVDWLLGCLSHNNVQLAVYSSRSGSLRGRRAMKSAIRRWGAAHFNAEGYESHQTWDRNFEMWLAAGYHPGMDMPAVEADEAGRWLVRSLGWPWFKPPALVTIDDRAVRFEGDWSAMDVDELLAMKPWMKRDGV